MMNTQIILHMSTVAWFSILHDVIILVLFHASVFADAFVLVLWTQACKTEGTSEFFKKSLPVAFAGKKISVGFPHWLCNLPLDQSSTWSIKQTGSAVFSQKWLSFYCQLL